MNIQMMNIDGKIDSLNGVTDRQKVICAKEAKTGTLKITSSRAAQFMKKLA
jgi:hypothetical protein